MTDQPHVDKTDTPPADKAAEADVKIAGDASEGEATAVPLTLGRPPLMKIFYSVLALIATLMLWIIAGNVKLQGCIEKAQAQYGNNTPAKSLSTLGRQNAIKRCSNSPL